MSQKENKLQIPMLALRGLVIFPGMLLHFDVGRKKSINAVNAAMEKNQTILLVSQKDIRENDPETEEIYNTGCIAKIKQILKLPGDNIRILIKGLYRAKISSFISENPYYLVEAESCENLLGRSTKLKREALIRHAQELFEKYANLSGKLSPDIVMGVMAATECGNLTDYIAYNLPLALEDKQELLEELNVVKRLEKLIIMLEKECRIFELDREIHSRVRDQIDDNQREYYLREQLKAIQAELSEEDDPQDEAEQYKDAILALNVDEAITEKLLKEAEKLQKMPYGSHEGTVVRNYLDACLELPWNTVTKESVNIKKSRAILNKEHYGLEKIKERIIEMLSARALNPDYSGQIICFVGPPGIGKTSIAKSIARCLNRKYARVSLGGVRDEADIRGHRKTYIGAMPGRIMTSIKLAGSKNPLILLDEVDKLGNDFRGDPSSALLEVLDSEQNHAFRDHYIEVPFDLSQVLFITTANNTSTIPAPLLDRMEVITLTSYTREEKFQIAKRHLLPKQLKRHGLTAKQARIQSSALYDLIDSYTREAGVRNLEREIASLCRKIAVKLVEGEVNSVSVNQNNIMDFLGVRRFKPEKLGVKDEVGLVNGLAWTSVGGEIMQIEASILDGNGKTVLTGSLGEVMKESAQAAISYIRSRAGALGIEKDFYKTKDIHIHATEGAVPKDGPSAGVTMATVLVSALKNLPVRSDLAMTGEITLRGRVLPIGGLKEKTMAAYKSGIQTVVLPSENEPDLEEIDDVVKENLEFVLADHMDVVLEQAFRTPVFNTPVLENKMISAKKIKPSGNDHHPVITQ